MSEATTTTTVRLPVALADRLRKATVKSGSLYPPTATAVIIRGIELALHELASAEAEAAAETHNGQ